jgi:hypothetical protein
MKKRQQRNRNTRHRTATALGTTAALILAANTAQANSFATAEVLAHNQGMQTDVKAGFTTENDLKLTYFVRNRTPLGYKGNNNGNFLLNQLSVDSFYGFSPAIRAKFIDQTVQPEAVLNYGTSVGNINLDAAIASSLNKDKTTELRTAVSYGLPRFNLTFEYEGFHWFTPETTTGTARLHVGHRPAQWLCIGPGSESNYGTGRKPEHVAGLFVRFGGK